MLNKKTPQEEYKRLRAEHDGLKARPDPEDIRKEFREREEKVPPPLTLTLKTT